MAVARVAARSGRSPEPAAGRREGLRCPRAEAVWRPLAALLLCAAFAACPGGGPARPDGYYAPPRFDAAVGASGDPMATDVQAPSDVQPVPGPAGADAFGAVPADPGARPTSDALPAVAAAAGVAASADWLLPDFVALYERVAPWVVNLYTTQLGRRYASPFVPGWAARPGEMGESLGSGILVDPRGYVLTTAQVIQNAADVRARLFDGTELRALVVGVDLDTGLATLALPAERVYPTAVFGDSDRLRVGDWVAALGNPFGLSDSLTRGVVSAMGRRAAGPAGDPLEYIQTDAAINPGSAGGPLCNVQGEVVGINAAVAEEGQRIGFAIPARTVRSVLPGLLAKLPARRAWLGAYTAGLRGGGLRVIDVVAGGPADRAGIVPGDVLLAFAGQPLYGPQDLARLVAQAGPGSRVRLDVVHAGRRVKRALTLGEHRITAAGAAGRPASPRTGPHP